MHRARNALAKYTDDFKGLCDGVRVQVATAVLIPAFCIFPLHLLYFGPLYPMILGIAILPALYALLLDVLDGKGRSTLRPVASCVVLLGGVGGLAGAHPGAMLAWLVSLNLALIALYIRRLSGKSWSRILTEGVGLAAIVLTSAMALLLLQPADQASVWGPNLSPLRSIVEVVTGDLRSMPVLSVTSLLVLVGLCFTIAHRKKSASRFVLLFWYAGFGFLYFVAAAQGHGRTRQALVGAWYQDPNRLALFALIPIFVIAVLGFAELLDAATKTKSDVSRKTVIGLALATVVAVSIVPGARVVAASAKPVFQLDENSALVSKDELELLEQVEEIVPPSAVIAGNVWQGAGMAYAFGDRKVLVPHLFFNGSRDVDLILDELNEAYPGSEVCDALGRTNVQFVLDFPGPSVYGDGQVYKGLSDLKSSSAVELVTESGDAKLYKVVGC